MSDTALAPCPFCGGEGFWQSEHDRDGFGLFWAIRCSGCGNGTQQHYVSHGSDCPEFRAEVRNSWNRRAQSALLEKAIRALEHIKRRLQMDIDDGSRPDQWSMEDLVRTADSTLAELREAVKGQP